jgi:protein arginine N-methyltransferase 6
VVLDVKVDIIVSEWMGFYLVHESMLDSVLVARDKHLKQESGFMLPSHASIWAAPCSLEDLKHTTIDYWRSVYGFDMSPLAQESIKRSKPEIMIISPDQLLAQPVCVANFDLNNVTIEDLSSIDKRHFVSATRPGSFHGLAIWFETPFSPNVEGWAHPQVLSTSPSSNPTHWKQTIIPLFSHTSEDIEEDEVIGWDLSLKKVHNDKSSEQRQYAIQVERLDPASEEHPVPCGCQAAKCVLIEALMAQDDIDNAGIDDISLKNKF